MLVIVINFPPLKDGKDEQFMEWFAWSNREFAKIGGFIGRRLLRPVKGGSYAAVMEHESLETFTAMQKSPEHGEAGRRVAPLFDGGPAARVYEVIDV